MKFKIMEAGLISREPNSWSVPKLISYIRKNCNPYLHRVGFKYYPMWRGTKDAPGLYAGNTVAFFGRVRKNRIPSDMSIKDQKGFDGAFLKVFGWKPRSQGLFVTGNESDAREYGTVYMIFPIGDFKFLYSYEIDDLYRKSDEYNIGNIEEFVKAYYTDKNLVNGIKTEHEIMLSCQSYLAVLSPDEDTWIEAREKIEKIIKGVFRK